MQFPQIIGELFMNTVCAILPLYNEEYYVKATIDSLKEIEYIKQIITVDDGSTDNTWKILREIKGIIRIRHKKNMGKAKAILDGINNYDADVYVFIDGDIGKSAVEMKHVIHEILCDTCDMCVANIPISKNSGGIGLLQWFSKFVVRTIAKIDFPCPLSGQRAVKKSVINDKRVHLYSGYGIEVGMLLDVLRCGYRVKTVDLDITHRTTGKDIKGFIHRFRQFNDVILVFLRNL